MRDDEEARRSDLINPVVRHCDGHAVPVSGCFRKVSPLGSPILASDFRQKIRAFWFLAFRPLYQKAGPRQEPLGRSQAGGRPKRAQGSGVFRALAGVSTRRIRVGGSSAGDGLMALE